MLLAKADEQDRASARDAADKAEEAATEAADQQVAQMYQKAGDESAQAWATGLGQLAGGVCEMVGGTFDEGSKCRTTWEGAAKTLPGVGTCASAPFRAWADDDAAAATRFEFRSQAAVRRENQAQQDAEAANASLQKLEDLAGQIEQAKNAARLSAASSRA
jgi:hypothetical protein